MSQDFIIQKINKHLFTPAQLPAHKHIGVGLVVCKI